MNITPRTQAKKVLLAALSRLTRRHVVLLAPEAAGDRLLRARAPYRAGGQRLVIELSEEQPGHLEAVLLAYAGAVPAITVWIGAARPYAGPCALTLDLVSGEVALGSAPWGRVRLPLPSRRFCWRLSFTAPDGHRRRGITGHYLPAAAETIDRGYFSGENYADHAAQSAADHARILRLLRSYRATGPLLEVGCATGGLLAALDAAGVRAVGVDVSQWAVGEAAQRLGPGRAWHCDVEREGVPPEVRALGPFGTIVMAAVLEHFRSPFAVLAQLTDLAATGAVLVLTTTNAESLTHTLFGAQWEGYFDATHHGIEAVTARQLRVELPRLGWRVAQLVTERIWDGNADPTHATLRDWWDTDARFRRLLAEHDLGDLITCVAIKGG